MPLCLATFSITWFVERYGIDEIDLLKLDIESGEREVFRLSRSWIDKVDVIIVELHDRIQTGCIRAYVEATAHGRRDLPASGEKMISKREALHGDRRHPDVAEMATPVCEE